MLVWWCRRGRNSACCLISLVRKRKGCCCFISHQAAFLCARGQGEDLCVKIEILVSCVVTKQVYLQGFRLLDGLPEEVQGGSSN